MGDRVARVVELSYLQLSLIFLILVLLKAFDIFSLGINYQLFAYLLPLFALPALLRFKEPEGERLRGILAILLGIFLFALALRLLPYVHNQVPLGYDPGLYKYTIDLYAGSLPQIPEGTLPTWVKEIYPQGLPLLTDALYVVAGMDAMQILLYLFPVLSAFVVFPVFILSRRLFGERIALVASLLYAVSYTQYFAFSLLYIKQALGLVFLLLALYALEKRSYMLLAVMIAALGIFHTPEFLLFFLILIPYLMLNRDKKIVYGAVGAAALILPFWLPRLDMNWSLFQSALGTTVSNIQTAGATGGGAFFDFVTYQEFSLAYLAFALIGALYLIVRRNWNSIFFYFAINLAMVLFYLFFFRRYIIPLDIVLLILAAIGIAFTFRQWGKFPMKAGAVATVLLIFVACGALTVGEASHAQPLIRQEQLQTIEWMAESTEADAFVVATVYDAPWVLGWSERKVVAPGLFQWNQHNREEWSEFLMTDDPDVARQFLDAYQGPIYVYYSRNPGNILTLDKFENEYFERVCDGEAVVYKYMPQ